jgi:prepilin-type N-terminal cleavage/methylation domain-containing protein
VPDLRVVMVTKFRKAFSLIEVLMSLVVLATLSIVIVNLNSRILLRAAKLHNKLIRVVPLANSLNSITLIDDLKKGSEKKEFGPSTKIFLKAESLENNDPFFDFKGVQKIIAEAAWDDSREELVRWIYIYQKNDKPEKKDSDKDEQKKTKDA